MSALPLYCELTQVTLTSWVAGMLVQLHLGRQLASLANPINWWVKGAITQCIEYIYSMWVHLGE